MSALGPVLAYLFLLFKLCTSLSDYRLGTLNRKGKIGDTFQFGIRLHPDLFKNSDDKTFQIQLFDKKDSRVIYNCANGPEDEEDYPVELPDGTSTLIDAPQSFTRIRLFQFSLFSPGSYGISIKPTIDTVNKKSQFSKKDKIQKIQRRQARPQGLNQTKLNEDIQTETVIVENEEANIQPNDCILNETFTVNSEEARSDHARATVVDALDHIILKRKCVVKTCTGRGEIKNTWTIERIQSASYQIGNTEVCTNYRKIARVNLPKLISLRTRQSLKVNMSLPSLIIQPSLLATDQYYVCLVLMKVKYTRRVCSVFEIKASDVTEDDLQLRVTPKQESFTWTQNGDILINATETILISETVEAGYLLQPSIRFNWTCQSTGTMCATIMNYNQYESLTSIRTRNYRARKEEKLMLIKHDWMVIGETVTITCNITADPSKKRIIFKTFQKQISFYTSLEHIRDPQINIRCLANCWWYVVPQISVLLAVLCQECEDLTLSETQISWSISVPTVKITGQGTLYLVISNLKASDLQEFLVTLNIIYIQPNSKIPKEVNVSQRFVLPSSMEPSDVDTIKTISEPDKIVPGQPPSTVDLDVTLNKKGRSYHYPIIYFIKVYGNDLDETTAFDEDKEDDTCSVGETPVPADHGCAKLSPFSSWQASLDGCTATNEFARLVVITSATKNNNLLNLAAQVKKAWIGLKVKGQKKYWIGGTVSSYENFNAEWYSSNETEEMMCVYIEASGKWGVSECDVALDGICEYYPFRKARLYYALITPTVPTDMLIESGGKNKIAVLAESATGTFFLEREAPYEPLQRDDLSLDVIINLMSEAKNNDLMYMAYITAHLRHLKDSEKETLIPMLLNELSTERDNIHFGNFHLVLVCLERIIKNINLNLINLNKAHELLSYVVEQQWQILIHATLNRVLTDYEINILDNIVQVFLALKQVGLLPSGPEELIISEGLMNTLDSILRLVAGGQIKGYPEMDKRSLTNSEVFTTWIDSSSHNVVEVDFSFHYLNMDMEIFYQGVNLFSLDPFLNIAVYTSFWSLLPNEQGGAIIDLPLLVISVEQKLPTQYALEKFVPDRYDIRFKNDHVIEHKDRYFFNMRTYLDQSEIDQETPKQKDQVQTGSNSFSDTDCLLIKVDISQHFSTMLHINGLEKMKMEVRANLYNSYAEALDIINEPPMILPRNETIYKNMLVKENVVFLPKLSLKQSITSAGGHYFVLINYARDQEVKGIQAGVSTITLDCMHVSCFWWSMYDDKWFSKFCRESAHSQHGQKKIPIISCFCDTGNIFSAGSSQCSEGHLVDWSSFELETLQWFDLNETNLFMAYVVLCLTMVFVALLVWSVRKDRLEYYESRMHVAPQLFSPWCTNNYIVCISTGVMPRCGTTAIPSITLIGDENFSFLISLEPLRGLFRTGSEVWFLLSTRVPLGNLLQAVISVDKTGNNRNWFISHMYLRHLETKKEWYFICDSWIPDTKTKKPFIIVDASSTPGSPGRLRLYAFIHQFRMHQLVVGSFFNMSNGYTKTPHVLLMWLTILLNFTIINAFMNLIRVQLRSDAAALRKKSSENVYTSATLYSVIITSLITYFMSLVFQRTNTISSLDSMDWKTEFQYESSREASTRTAADKLPDIVDSNEDTRASEMTSELIDSPDPKLRSEAYKTTGLRSPESTDKQRSGEHSLMSERTKSQQLSYNKVSKGSRNLNTNSLSSASKLREKRVGSPVDPDSDRLRVLAYHNYIELLENLAIAYPKETWRKNIFTRHKASIRHSYPLIQTCLMMLPTIIFLSYFLAMNGYFLGRNWNFILSALAGFLAIIFLLHPFYIFLSLLMMEGLNVCSGEADVRLKACLETLYTKAKCTALGKLRPRRVVNFENSEIPPTMIRYSKLIAKASKKSTETVNSEESKTEKESGRADKIFTVMFILMIIFFINVQTGDIHSSYLQSKYIKRLCQVGRTEIILDTSLLMEDFWYKMRDSFFSKPSYILNSPQTTSTFKAVSNGRIQQYRVLNQTDCREKNPKLIEPLCHFDVENTEQDTRHFAFTWAKPTTKVVPSGPYKHTQTEPYVTINHFYPPGGYEVVYSIRDTKPVMIDYLESKNWVDFYTRAVKIDLALYNADTKMLTVIEHVFEFTSIGITQESIQVSTFPLIYSKDSTNMLFLMVILISVFNVAFGIADIILIYRRGFRKHFSTYFSWLNLLERIFSVCVIVGFLVKMSYTKRAVKDVQNVYFENKEATVYINFAFATTISTFIQTSSCMMALVIFIKIILKSNNIPALSQFLELVPPVFSLLYLPILTVMCFAYMGYGFFHDMEEFQSFLSAYFTTTNLMLNQNVIKEIVEYKILSVLYIVLYFSVMNYIVLNYFIVLLTEHYARIMEERVEQETESLLQTFKKWYQAQKLEKTDLEDAKEQDKEEEEEDDSLDNDYISLSPKSIGYGQLINYMNSLSEKNKDEKNKDEKDTEHKILDNSKKK